MVEKEVQQSVARFLVRDMKEELPGLVTVTHVKMPSDLRAARVSVSLLLLEGGDEAAGMKETLEILKAWAPEIQDHVNHELRLRYVPKLNFVADTSMANALHIENVLRDLKKSDNK